MNMKSPILFCLTLSLSISLGSIMAPWKKHVILETNNAAPGQASRIATALALDFDRDGHIDVISSPNAGCLGNLTSPSASESSRESPCDSEESPVGGEDPRLLAWDYLWLRKDSADTLQDSRGGGAASSRQGEESPALRRASALAFVNRG